MTRRAVSTLRFALAAAAGTACLFIGENVASIQQGSLVTQADARVGRPWTAVSVAGVARRHARRAYYRSGGYAYVPRYGAYAAAYPAAAYSYASYNSYNSYNTYPAVYPTSYYSGYANYGYGPTYYTGYTNHGYAPSDLAISGSYGTYAAVSPPSSYGGYTTYSIAPSYGAYAAAYPTGYYGGYANRSYVTGRPTLFPRYYNAGYRW